MISPRRIQVPLEERTRKELLELARQQGIPGSSRMKKAQLLARLRVPTEIRSEASSIAIVAWEGAPGEQGGDLGHYVEHLARSLAASGADVHLFARARETGRAIVDGLPVHGIAIERRDDIVESAAEFGTRAAEAIREEERRRGRPFSVLHAHDWTGAEAIRQMGERTGRYVLTMHSVEAIRCGDWPWPVSPAIESREQEAALRADEILVLEERVADHLVGRYGVDEGKIRLIAAPFPFQRFEGPLADPGAVKARYAIGPVDPMILYLGPLDEDHGADVLLDAVPQVIATESQARFVFVGAGILADALRRRVDELGIGAVVRFLGHRDGREVEDLVRAADLVVVPSRRPTSDGPVLCAWSAGRPVVVTEEGPSADVRDEETGLRARAEPTALAGGIRRVFADWDRARRVGQTGHDLLRRKHSWEAYAGRILELYRA